MSLADKAQHFGILRDWVERGNLLALTIHQPFAHWILMDDDQELRKRVENRSWCPPRWLIGRRIVIHAGMSRQKLSYMDDVKWPLKFGAALGTVKIAGALRKRCTGSPATGWEEDEFPAGYEWLATHRHSEGPVCWVLENVWRWVQPVECSGAQGLWKWEGRLPEE
jgi:hypothetical protein